jgi:putative ABC transport system permease protein
MLKNYLKTAWRNLAKSRLYSMLNIVGLAVGMAAFLLKR